MKLFKLVFAFGLVTVFAKISIAQNLNVTFRSQLSYPGQTLANICGYVDSLGNEYALVGASMGMSIVDVTNPSAPVEIMQVPGFDSQWREIKVSGKYAYVTNQAGGGLQIVNLSSLPDTTGVVFQNWLGDGAIAGQLDDSHTLHIDGNFVYLYGSNLFNGGALVADISNPWTPTYVGNFEKPGAPYIHDGYVRNDTMYGCHIYQGFFTVVDFTNKSAPVELATQVTPNNFTHNSWLSTDSKTLFTTDEVDGSFVTAYNISNLASIVELDRIQSNPGSNSIGHNVHINQVLGNDYAVTSWYKDGFIIIDAGRPQNLVQVANYDTYVGGGGGFAGDWGVYPNLPSGTIVVSNIGEGLFVFSPTYVRACYLEGIITDTSCGIPLFNVDISVAAAGISDSTDVAGNYRTGTPLPGTYSVTFSKSGYITQIISGVVLTPGVVTVLDVVLVPSASITNLTGATNDAITTNPLPGVNVLITDPANTYNFISDAGGLFNTCNAVADVDYNITVGLWGYNEICLTNQVITAPSTNLTYNLDPGYYDDFTFNLGWTSSGTSLTGIWEIGEPVGTTNMSDQSNPDVDVNNDCNDQAYVTGNGGGSAGTDDIDNGSSILTSPVFDLSSYSDPKINYSRWFYNGGGFGGPNDTMNITLDNGITTVVIETITVATAGISTWVPKSFLVSDYIAPTANMKIIVKAEDFAPGHLVEGGFDKFFIYESVDIPENVQGKNHLYAYPNPFTDITNISYELQGQLTDNSSIIVLDAAGRWVHKENIASLKGTVSISSFLGAGIYFVKIKIGRAHV